MIHFDQTLEKTSKYAPHTKREYNFGPEKKFEELHYQVLKIWFADAILVQDFSSNLDQNRPFK